MHSQYFSGMIGRDGHSYVMRYRADPNVRQIDAVQDTFKWGPDATREQRVALAQYLLKPYNVDSYLAEEFADEVVRRMMSGAMWMISEENIMTWLETRQIAA